MLPQAGALEREVQAVDSEFSGVLQSDHSRLAQLMCHTVSSVMRWCIAAVQQRSSAGRREVVGMPADVPHSEQRHEVEQHHIKAAVRQRIAAVQCCDSSFCAKQ